MYVCMYVCNVRTNANQRNITNVYCVNSALDMPDLHWAREAVLNQYILFIPRNELIIKFRHTELVHKILHIPRKFCEGKYRPVLFKLTSNMEKCAT
jgi:hypothetical protein